MFCTRTCQELSSGPVYKQIKKNRENLEKCYSSFSRKRMTADFCETHLLSLQSMLCNILLKCAMALCDTYITATDNFWTTRDAESYKLSLFIHQHQIYHADLDYHWPFSDKTSQYKENDAIFTSNFVDRCDAAVTHAYTMHTYVDYTRGEILHPITQPLIDLIQRILHSTSMLYTPLTLPPDIVDNKKLAADCRQCSKDAVLRGTMTLSKNKPKCNCIISVYSGKNIDGGMHAPETSARRFVFDTTQRIMCIQSNMCDCARHKQNFADNIDDFKKAITGKK